MENQARLKGKVFAALAYPVLMMFVGTGLVGFLMVAVVPRAKSASLEVMSRYGARPFDGATSLQRTSAPLHPSES